MGSRISQAMIKVQAKTSSSIPVLRSSFHAKSKADVAAIPAITATPIDSQDVPISVPKAIPMTATTIK